MGKKFYISDLHYGHANAISFDNRPFRTVDEMNAALINNWNYAVEKDDTVYILGDMFWCKTSEAVSVMDRLNGLKYLITGNHDRIGRDSELRSRFVGIKDYAEIKDDGRNVVLCHYPIPCFKNHYYGWYHLYGHVHSSFEWNMMESVKRQMIELYDKHCRMYNVGAMMPYMNYTPRTLNEILEEAGNGPV